MSIDKNDGLETYKEDLPFSRLLKFWRTVHGLSQESLALDIGSSSRHISFLENGKAHPSKEMVLKLASQLSLGIQHTSNLVTSAGYTESIDPLDFHSESPGWLRKAMKLTLRAMDPYPATLMDSTGKILMVNKSWVGFFSLSVDETTLNSVENHFDFIFNRKAAGNIISSRDETLCAILMTLTQDGIINDDQTTLDTVERLASHPDVPKNWRQIGAEVEPLASYRVQLNINGKLMRFYNVTQSVSAYGSIGSTTGPQITTNTLYPEDDNFDLAAILKPDVSHPLLFE